MSFYSAALLCLAVLAPFAPVQADSSVFSQFIGATVAPTPTDTSAIPYFTICTNYLHGLPALTDLSPSESTQLEQVAVDGVCQFCTSLGQSRVDSCCAQATSSACFDQFAAANANAAQTTPASASATPTTALTGDSGTTASSSSNAGVIGKASLRNSSAVTPC
ncbi:uncharacterized protein Z519_12004 [Cladophialophora bantiana CBS 173.52]|uniref:Fungal calcium binding protein domain-containing protein n=1 Tax=Cladophialophora bantiana (strain ATCC 10958 / CBS 173.52 / CDC B-1940 / NIH 8579) TaxID=1442370 RepID=A0A0D2H237_CLAB1|nr:uncharacterized protein Z519_12004 [Cladophialophora bantiana CBS 173.52]KIW87368.1 hypothetical protein Z519_12004 [Cladophialophora bantiana CBS 173.52]